MSLICENKLFKTAFFNAIEERQVNTKRALTDSRHQRKNRQRWWIATIRYYEAKIQQVDAALEVIYQNSGNKPKTQRSRKGLTMRTRCALLGHLSESLDWHAWQYHAQVKGSDILPNPTKADLHKLYKGTHSNTMAARALNIIPTQFIAYITDIIINIRNDWDELNAIFFPDSKLSTLKDIIPIRSQTYKKGKSVVILVFEGRRNHSRQTQELRLVYKPSDLYFDYQIVGDTTQVRAALQKLKHKMPPALKKARSLFETINALINHKQWVPNPAFRDKQRLRPELPVYSILPKYPGQVAQAYGYLQYLSHTPEASNESPSLEPTLLFSDWDWITNRKDDLIDYYRLFGWYIVIALTFGIVDIHTENLIVHKKKPYLIDIELAFRGDTHEIGKTGLSSIMDLNQFSEESPCHIFYKKKNRHHPTTGEKAAYWIKHAIDEASDLLATDPSNAIRNWLHSTALAGTIARYLPEPIETYVARLQSSYESLNVLQPAPSLECDAADFLPNDCFSCTQRIREWYNGEEPDLLPNYAMSTPEHDWYDYMCCDIPVYYQQLNQMDLINARGQIVCIAAPSCYWNDPKINAKQDRLISGPHYFDHSPGVYLFQMDLTTLSTPGNNSAHLDQHLIVTLKDGFKNSHQELTKVAQATTEIPGSHWRIKDGKTIYHIRLQKGTRVIKVYKTASVIEVIQKQYRLFREDNPFRNQLVHKAKKDVESYYASKKNNDIYNDF